MPINSTSSNNNTITTPLYIVKECLKLIPIEKNDTCLDCCSGLNKVWYNNFNCNNKLWCEILLNVDFLNFDTDIKMDYLIGNLPFNKFKLFFEKIIKMKIDKGIGIICLEHSITPLRLQKLNKLGFYLIKIRKLKIKEWKFGFNVNFFYFEKKYDDFCEVLMV